MKSSFKALAPIALIGTLTLTLASQASTFRLDIERAGVTHEMVVYDLWSGEYPGPVVAVGKSDKGTTTVLGSSSLRQPTKDQKCEISNGLYHPWAEPTKSKADFFTITGYTEYVAKKDIEIQYLADEEPLQTITEKISKGEKLSKAIYLGEGFCQFTVDKSQAEVELDCAQVDDNADFEKVDRPAHATEQWIKFSCLNGGQAYVEVNDLLKQRGVREGQIQSYGTVTR